MKEEAIKLLKNYLGVISIGDYVLYIKGGDLSALGVYKKDIWKVLEFTPAGVEIQNISKPDTTFRTLGDNLIDLSVIRDFDRDWKSYISTKSLAAYKRVKASSTYEPNTEWIDEAGAVDAARYYQGVWTEQGVKYQDSNTKVEDTKTTGEVTMMNRLVNDNMNAAKTGAVLSAGNTLNKVVKDAVRGQVPRKYRKMLDIPGADIVVANVANVAVQHFAKTNRKALVATNAMMEAAMVEFFNSFNIDQIISDTLKSINIDELIDSNV